MKKGGQLWPIHAKLAVPWPTPRDIYVTPAEMRVNASSAELPRWTPDTYAKTGWKECDMSAQDAEGLPWRNGMCANPRPSAEALHGPKRTALGFVVLFWYHKQLC